MSYPISSVSGDILGLACRHTEAFNVRLQIEQESHNITLGGTFEVKVTFVWQYKKEQETNTGKKSGISCIRKCVVYG